PGQPQFSLISNPLLMGSTILEHLFENNLIHPLPASLKALRQSLSRLTRPKGYAPGVKETLRSIHPLDCSS
ncbi:MAG: hypothetical protein QGG90_00210, partial [Nitrospinota bacterium]|nr:hypothetical protein [Nitrospinota bacterium]